MVGHPKDSHLTATDQPEEWKALAEVLAGWTHIRKKRPTANKKTCDQDNLRWLYLRSVTDYFLIFCPLRFIHLETLHIMPKIRQIMYSFYQFHFLEETNLLELSELLQSGLFFFSFLP